MDLVKQLKKSLGQVDIYLLDQIMKNRYLKDDCILDAGCGKGRNLIFLENLGYKVSACDSNQQMVYILKHLKSNIIQADLKDLPYSNSKFDHIICNAVLHFATSNNLSST